MSGFVALGAGLVAYLVVLALIGFRHGEAPGGLARIVQRLSGEQPHRRGLWRWGVDGSITKRQRVSLSVSAAVILGGASWLLSHSWLVSLVLASAAPFYPLTLEQSMVRRRRELLEVQFGMALQSMVASLQAGASLRTAVQTAPRELERMLVGQPLKPMVVELQAVCRDLDLGLSLEEALVGFRDRVHTEDVTDFVGAVLLCRSRGGNAAMVMANIARIVADKIAVRQQIRSLTAGKRLEGNLVTFAPPVLVILLTIISPDYLMPLYTRVAGQILLLIGCGCLAGAFFLGRRLSRIEI